MSWRAQNVLSLLLLAVVFVLNALPVHSQEKAMAGKMAIVIADGKHSHDSEYTPP
jgi:hypothetical protein